MLCDSFKEDSCGTVIRQDVSEFGGVAVRYRLYVKRENNTAMYSIFAEGETYGGASCISGFSNSLGDAVRFYNSVVKAVVTPSTLRYVYEDERG